MSGNLKVGIIGLDTSHAVVFTKLLNDPSEKHHVPGGKVVIAFPGGSPDFDLSISRVEGFTNELRSIFNVKITESIEQVAEKSDAILLESVDGRVHLEQLRRVISYRKPIFIDKPFSLKTETAAEMVKLASVYQTPVMSTSALRYADNLIEILSKSDKGEIIGADCFGPMEMQVKQPGFFWYGIHSVEMLFVILGKDFEYVTTITNDDHDVIIGQRHDGLLGTIRGNRKGNNQFGALIHFEQGTEYVDVTAAEKPYYASLLAQIMDFFQDGVPRVSLAETREVIRFIEAANESRITGKQVLI
ncbi:gfo/Idh/MocA family oxidoreductase [Gracilibacillus salitolerans]|uniref:Gfo/Idh/MocA family oxidoreductase n=1 Tax=Gracilibacillus salitolerans TaxID=2663022 RepID=A0A5Q2TGZ5_9BACI|nr:gfo/Idh/MocA family oxidoreductase [Gracilibacillus salitolerans]QGH33467.1 gfo/Idh/MocA family oxidoreductase [Gracilibacillus salitolerans]